MAEIVLPLCRTVFLPAGSPGISSIEQVRGDLRDLRCGCTDGEVYCSGEADILVDYISYMPGCDHGPFAPAPTDQGAGEHPWQAMLTMPFQLCGKGELPPDVTYRVDMGEIHWCMVAARALEMETTITIRVVADEAMRTEEIAGKKTENGGGGWTMVGLQDDDNMKELAGHDVEVVRIGNAEESDIRDAIIQALSDADAETQSRETWARQLRGEAYADAETREFVATEEAMAMVREAALDIAEAAAEISGPVPAPSEDFIIKMMFPEKGAPAEAAPEMINGSEPADSPEPAEMHNQGMSGLLGDLNRATANGMAAEEILQAIEEDGRPTADAGAKHMPEQMAFVAEEPAAEQTAFAPEEPAAEQMTFAPEESVPEQTAFAAEESAPEQMTFVAGESAPEQLMFAEAQAIPPTETAIAEAAPLAQPSPAASAEEKAPRQRKRRFMGLPGVNVEAANNDIDITGFQINIRL